jgi:formiminoglutamase
MKHHIAIYHRNAVQPDIALRAGESKLGEHLCFMEPGETLLDLKTYVQKGIRFALLGIPESIGVEANFGECCTDNAWPVFLKFFLNIQSNRFLKGDRILCLGHIDTWELNQVAAALDRAHPDTIQQLRLLCSKLDDRVYPVIEKIVRAGIIPVVIGGGHNNAYPIIKGTARALGEAGGINCINCDPHADYRPLEGRHSGNSFSYAVQQGYLSRYFVVGLHESYNPEAALESIDRNEHVAYSLFEPHANPIAQIKQALKFFKNSSQPVGVELDLDSIADMPSSSATPSGLSVEDARLYIRETASKLQPAYLHLPEGAPIADSNDELKVGKTLAYLVADFIKTCCQKVTD